MSQTVTIRNVQGKRIYQVDVEEDGTPMGIHRSGLPVAQESGRAMAQAVQSAIREGASLRGACLSGDLSRLDLSSGDFREAVFDGCDCSYTSFNHADLTSAKAEFTSFANAKMVGIKADSFIASDCSFVETLLERAVLRHAKLVGCLATACRAPFADGTDAEFKNVVLYGSDLSDSVLRGLRAINVNWERGTFCRANAEGASIEGSLVVAECRRAIFRNARLDVDARRASFAECDMRASTLVGDFDSASFDGSRLADARWDRAKSANLFGATLA